MIFKKQTLISGLELKHLALNVCMDRETKVVIQVNNIFRKEQRGRGNLENYPKGQDVNSEIMSKKVSQNMENTFQPNGEKKAATNSF